MRAEMPEAEMHEAAEVAAEMTAEATVVLLLAVAVADVTQS